MVTKKLPSIPTLPKYMQFPLPIERWSLFSHPLIPGRNEHAISSLIAYREVAVSALFLLKHLLLGRSQSEPSCHGVRSPSHMERAHEGGQGNNLAGTAENHRIKGNYPPVDTLLRYLLSPGHEDRSLYQQASSSTHTLTPVPLPPQLNPCEKHDSLVGPPEEQQWDQRGITSI